MRSRIAYFVALLCLVYNLYLLYEDSYALIYRTAVEDIADPFNFSLCLPLEDLEKQMDRDKKVYDLRLNGVVNSTVFIDRVFAQIGSMFVQKFPAEKKNVSHFLKRDRCYLFKKHLCFLVSEHHLNVVFAFKELHYKILLVSSSSKSFFFNSVYWNDNERSYLTHTKLFKLIIKNFDNPFSSCVKHREAGQPPYSKFNCLNDCLKSRDKKFSYYYEAGELIDLDDSVRDRQGEEHCYDQCKRESCFLEYILAVSAIKPYDDEKKLPVATRGKLRTLNPVVSGEYINLDVYPAIKLSDFYLQFIGLISLFFDINVIETLPGLVRFVSLSALAAKPRWIGKFKKIYPKLKFLLLIISVYAFVEIALYMCRTYHEELERPINSQLSLYSTEVQPFSLYLCYPVRALLERRPLNKLLDRKYDEQIMTRYTFDEIENLTNPMPPVRTFLKYGSLENEIRLEFSEKVFFRTAPFLFENPTEMFARCFLLNVHKLQEERYKSLLANTKMVLKMDTPFVAVYLATLNASLESAYLYKGRFLVNKYRVSLLETSKLFNCTNYPGRFKGCDSRDTCLNRCKVRGYLKKYSKFPAHNRTVVEKDRFDGYLLRHTHFAAEEDVNLTRYCEEKFSNLDCEIELFLESYKTQDLIYNSDNQTTIELFLEILVDRDLKSTKEKTAFAILNVESILIGGNVTKLLLTVLAFVRITFKTKWWFWFKPLVFLLCFLGFLVHMYVISRQLIDGELFETGYFNKNDTVRFPDLIFCFKFDSDEIDRNHRLTGYYLDRWSNLTFSNVFEKISYLTQDGVPVEVSNFTDTVDLSFSTFFLMNMKCFRFRVHLVYEEKWFLFAEDPFALKFWLHRNMTVYSRTIYFTCKQAGSKQLNIMDEFRFKSGHHHKRSKYQIKLELLRIVYSEAKLFEYFRNPWTILLGSRTELVDATLYYEGMSREFKALFNSTSKLIMLDRDFDLELDDHLFLQYFYQVQNVSDFYYPVSNNSEQFVYHKYIQNIKYTGSKTVTNYLMNPEFEITINFFAQEVIFTREDNVVKVIQNILNSLALWLNICIIDVFDYLFRAIRLLFGLSENCLRKWRFRLESLLV